MQLTRHERHARLVKLVRRTYQKENFGSRLFPNTSGMAWQGDFVNVAGGVFLRHARPIRFGIPEPREGGSGSGGADLIGATIVNGWPVFTAVECKTKNARLQKNQKAFRRWVQSISGIYVVARECPECWENWDSEKKNGKVIAWRVPWCGVCGGRGFLAMEE